MHPRSLRRGCACSCDASVDVSFGDVNSTVSVEASADAAASASADGGDANTVDITGTDLEGGNVYIGTQAGTAPRSVPSRPHRVSEATIRSR